jgi:hypothetical protein
LNQLSRCIGGDSVLCTVLFGLPHKAKDEGCNLCGARVRPSVTQNARYEYTTCARAPVEQVRVCANRPN